MPGPRYSERVSMDGMFEDLEGRLAHLEDQQIRATAEDLARAERSQVALVDRLRAAEDLPLVVHLTAGSPVEGPVAEVGRTWILLGRESDRGARAVIPLAQTTMIEGLPARARPASPSRLGARPLTAVLRRIARDRSLVRVRMPSATLPGRLASVGEDFVDIVSQPTGERGAVANGATSTVPTAAIVLISLD